MSVSAGQTPTAAQLNGLSPSGLTAWTDFSSSAIVVAGSGGFVKGSSTYSAHYTQVGKIVIYAFQININTGGGFATGTGIWSFLLPVTAQASLLGTGTAKVVDNGTAIYTMAVDLSDSTHARVYKNAGLSALDNTGPGTAWATGDVINASITYEAA